MKKVILLIDFKGHQILADDYVNKLRYSTLQQITENPSIDRNSSVILSIGSSNEDEKLQEIRNIAVKERWKWLEIHNDNSNVEDIEKLVSEKLNYSMNNTNTQIIIGGCNTSGCVLKSKLCSAKHFSDKKYKTNIVLPMCAEYEASGINDIEKNMKAFVRVYNYVKKNKLNYIDVVEAINDIDFKKIDT
jgi:hypothetical protein